jgi:glycosyltransferase involved in cell wall biosynthesis
MNPTKVVHITTVASSLRFLCGALLRNLQDVGYQVSGVSSPGDEIYTLREDGIAHAEIVMTRRVTPLADVLALCKLYRLMRRERFMIVHTHTPKANLLGQIAARLAGVPVRISTVHGLYFTSETPAAKRTLFHLVESWSARFADVVFLVNREDVETIRCRRICVPHKVRLLGGGIGIDITRFSRQSLNQSRLAKIRSILGLADGCKVVGFVGRLVAEKGLHELLRAAAALRRGDVPVRVLIVGAPDHARPDVVFPELAREYGVEDLCIFTGAREDVPYLYALMDVFVLPSHREGCPVAVMEAASMELPCVVTDVRGCRDVVEHEKSGLIVPRGDVSALAAAIFRLLLRSDEARQMGRAARRFALERFDERPVFEKIRFEYARLLRERGVPAPQSAPTSLLEALN